MAKIIDLIATTAGYLRIGLQGVRLKNSSGNLLIRSTNDSTDAALTASKVNISGDELDINSDAAGSAADWLYRLQRPSTGMTAAVTLTLPPTNGSPGQVLSTDGDGVLDWAASGGSSANVVSDTTALAFGSGASVAMFTLPADHVVHLVEVIVDTAFNGTPSMSVGISGSASKYVASSQVDLTYPANSVFSIHPGLAPNVASESLVIAYTAGSSTQGSARAIVHYSEPA